VATFITFEGTEGSGKSTQAALLAENLRAAGREVVLTHEPGGTDVTLAIRRLLADPESILDSRAELLLFLADRAQHVATVIRPALERGAIVVCDRYADSTMAYQGYGRGHKLPMLRELSAWASRDLDPDLTIWIDVDIEVGLHRARGGDGGPGDRFEAEPLAFHSAIHTGFTALAAAEPGRFVRIDGNRELDAVTVDVIAAVHSHLS
jgi:dTMP kinase